jgi:hypothetical protein
VLGSYGGSIGAIRGVGVLGVVDVLGVSDVSAGDVGVMDGVDAIG